MRGLTTVTDEVDRRVGWDRLPFPLTLAELIGLRARLRRSNLYDTGLADPTPPKPPADGRHLRARLRDGTFNDLDRPRTGSLGERFGRNVPAEHTFPEEPHALLEPSPRTVSRELLTRARFVPAPTVNVLAAAWLQFEVHDWFSHGTPDEQAPWEFALADDDPWPERPMRIRRTRRDPTADADPTTPPTFVTADTHWWDGSQIYGSDERFAAAVRANEDGKLRIDDQGLLPPDLDELADLSGVGGNFWIGLALLHVLFTLEHNAICGELRRSYPTWPDERLYDTARLVNAAVMAKIHTVEWTPALIAQRTTRAAMNAVWWGLLGRRAGRRLGRRSGELLHGIPGSPTDHHGVPYSLTEEFVAVYRMHQLLPDEFAFRAVDDDRPLAELTFDDVGALQVRRRLDELGPANALYSLGVASAGAVVLWNFPRSLQEFHRPDGTLLDLAAADVLRTRERGVPRYCEFRRLFRLAPPSSFEELTGGDLAAAAAIERVYGGDIERVDLMIGLLAEPKPAGFAFSDTAFRIFLLMASRRLQSDRFFTADYTPRVYTPEGLAWIERTSLADVLRRHYPQLEPALRRVTNAFAPWSPRS